MAAFPRSGLGSGSSQANGNAELSAPGAANAASQGEKAFRAASTFLSGILAINASQLMGAPLKYMDPALYDGYMAQTKESFAVLITSMTQWFAPTKVRVSGDESMRGQLIRQENGDLKCNFPDRIVLMANHQLYTDWLYLWWSAYTNGMHGRIYIILKESVKNIPIIGWGAQFYNFIFLKRNWEKDKPNFQKHLQKLNRPSDPMWLLIFPEGTNLARGTKESSKRWAAKNGIPDMKHQLLPRSTGLQFCLQQLKDTTEWLYDCTIGYEGIPPGEFGQDVFTLRSSFLDGRPPKSVNMHWRRFRISSIPIDDHNAFDIWLRNRWTEKDHLLEYFVRTGHFPADEPWKVEKAADGSLTRKEIRPAKCIETEVKSSSWQEFESIFAPITAVGTVMTLFYGGGTAGAGAGSSAPPSVGGTSGQQQEELIKEAIATAPKEPAAPGKQKETVLNASKALNKKLSKDPKHEALRKALLKKQQQKVLAAKIADHKNSSPGKALATPKAQPKGQAQEGVQGEPAATQKPMVNGAGSSARQSKAKAIQTLQAKPQTNGTGRPSTQADTNPARRSSAASVPTVMRAAGQAKSTSSTPALTVAALRAHEKTPAGQARLPTLVRAAVKKDSAGTAPVKQISTPAAQTKGAVAQKAKTQPAKAAAAAAKAPVPKQVVRKAEKQAGAGRA
ncbi:hypothetical protein B0A49_07000 [Cryomyces minteri]|uniref:Phospholipid/glycerol acyltransferase domain-containing protein n=1 Tax=Cryomyces minteri TaxID=331657 RepID=A0A4U0XLI0_9PEZI|nr:hypothetical protein B0A49_07000 [Cryomyces minteri]